MDEMDLPQMKKEVESLKYQLAFKREKSSKTVTEWVCTRVPNSSPKTMIGYRQTAGALIRSEAPSVEAVPQLQHIYTFQLYVYASAMPVIRHKSRNVHKFNQQIAECWMCRGAAQTQQLWSINPPYDASTMHYPWVSQHSTTQLCHA